MSENAQILEFRKQNPFELFIINICILNFTTIKLAEALEIVKNAEIDREKIIRKALSFCTMQERQILETKFGINGQKILSSQEISKITKLSTSRISTILHKSFAKISKNSPQMEIDELKKQLTKLRFHNSF